MLPVVLSWMSARPTLVLSITDSLLNYAMTAFVLALVATGAAHLLSMTTPRPRVFFGWLVGLGTAAANGDAVSVRGSLSGKISTALINLAVGIAIGTLLTAVLSRTVTDPERSWQAALRCASDCVASRRSVSSSPCPGGATSMVLVRHR